MDPMIKNSFFTILIYWNDNRIHLGLTKKLIFFIWFPPPNVTVEAVAQHQPHPGSSEGVQQRLCGRLRGLQPAGSLDSERARGVHGKVSPPEEATQKMG